MEFVETSLPGAWLIRPRVIRDERGFFLESYLERLCAEHGIPTAFVQDNHSRSLGRGVVRGLHFQRPPHAQAKLVRVVRGAIFDAIVDLRVGSPTYGTWQGFTLDDSEMAMLYVPRGFAHGFCTLSDIADVAYKTDDYYARECDGGLFWSDPDIGVHWPVTSAILSPKDQALPRFAGFQSPFGREPE